MRKNMVLQVGLMPVGHVDLTSELYAILLYPQSKNMCGLSEEEEGLFFSFLEKIQDASHVEIKNISSRPRFLFFAGRGTMLNGNLKADYPCTKELPRDKRGLVSRFSEKELDIIILNKDEEYPRGVIVIKDASVSKDSFLSFWRESASLIQPNVSKELSSVS